MGLALTLTLTLRKTRVQQQRSLFREFRSSSTRKTGDLEKMFPTQLTYATDFIDCNEAVSAENHSPSCRGCRTHEYDYCYHVSVLHGTEL